jgi:hypothetical protein
MTPRQPKQHGVPLGEAILLTILVVIAMSLLWHTIELGVSTWLFTQS